jgi:hypothetical protein
MSAMRFLAVLSIAAGLTISMALPALAGDISVNNATRYGAWIMEYSPNGSLVTAYCVPGFTHDRRIMSGNYPRVVARMEEPRTCAGREVSRLHDFSVQRTMDRTIRQDANGHFSW